MTVLLWLVMQTTASSTTQPVATAPAATTRPVAAVWYHSSGPPIPNPEPRRLIVGVWGDGRVVWSDDRMTGGKPYRTARIERQRVEQLAADLDAAEFFAEQRKVNFGPDASYTVLAGERGTSGSGWARGTSRGTTATTDRSSPNMASWP